MTKKMLFLLALLVFASPIFAQTGGAAAQSNWWVSIGSGVGMAIASGLCALGQGKAIAGACEGMARNPGVAAGHPCRHDSGLGLYRIAGALHARDHLY